MDPRLPLPPTPLQRWAGCYYLGLVTSTPTQGPSLTHPSSMLLTCLHSADLTACAESPPRRTATVATIVWDMAPGFSPPQAPLPHAILPHLSFGRWFPPCATRSGISLSLPLTQPSPMPCLTRSSIALAPPVVCRYLQIWSVRTATLALGELSNAAGWGWAPSALWPQSFGGPS